MSGTSWPEDLDALGEPAPADRARAASDLDPDDWDDFRAQAHGALDGMIDHLRTVRDRAVWTPTPAATRQRFRSGIPREGRALGDVVADVERHIRPHVVGNTHPLFMGWVHGAGTPVGMVAEMLAAGLNANCGGRDHVAHDVERQIAAWAAEAFGFPPESSGIFVTGTSAGNFLSLVVARHRACADIKRDGRRDQDGALTAYASVEAHECVRRAMDLAGLGTANLRLIATDGRRRIDPRALRAAIALDRAGGSRPFLVVGSAGTVNTGAIDDLDAVADICAAEGLWFHVDGAFGALAAFSPALRPLLRGLERADSVAFDFHKWFHVPYDAGFFLVRDPAAHRAAFAAHAAYLSREPRGLAAGSVWPCDLGMDLSRGFRALKTWMTIEVFGMARLTGVIERTCDLARHLEVLVTRSARLQLRAPVALNIVCFGVRGDGDGALARAIIMDLHEEGSAAPSLTLIDGVPAIRAAIVNHRTRREDVEAFAAMVEAAAQRLLRGRADPAASCRDPSVARRCRPARGRRPRDEGPTGRIATRR